MAVHGRGRILVTLYGVSADPVVVRWAWDIVPTQILYRVASLWLL